jgi:allophanate hydrolase subunit 1
VARTGTKKTTTRRPRKTSAAKRTTKRTTTRTAAPAAERGAVTAATAAGIADLAGGLKSFLTAIETEVRSVTALSERIDALVTELNAVREEQAQRLIALDTLRGSARDGGLTSFLDKLIRPRSPRVPEVVPERLTQ